MQKKLTEYSDPYTDPKKMTADEMAAALTHEFKNPIALIKANVDYIKSCEKDDSLEKNFSLINRELMKIDDMISLLTQKTGTAYEEGICDIVIADMIEDITNEYDISLRNKHISFLTITEEDGISIKGERSKLSILFYNIYKNAVESIEKRGNILTEISRSGQRVTVEIKDNGSGISEEDMKKIEKPFFTTKRNGSGLGLAICRSIAAEHGGSMYIKNNDMGGTT
ncbi:MAG: HAMP domain-containing histidine kinase, partial [Firmicutes bacterium]|nr:HAMP domain-containing histidine kinase [Bacillota bacterium]